MRHWLISYPDENGENVDEILSELDIKEQYWPHWYGKMCEKFGKDHVDANYTFEDCLYDWQVVHWAVPVNECPWNNWRPNREIR